MNTKQLTEEAAQNDNNEPNHKRGRSLGSLRMINKKNIIAIESQKKLMNKIIIQEEEDNSANMMQNLNEFKAHLHKSLSPKLKSQNSNSVCFLPPKKTKKKTLVLDLDETLVHSSFVPYGFPADIAIKINIEGQKYDIYVLIRPGLKEFLKIMAEHFELVLFTASLSSYANPVMNIIDRERHCSYRLYREHCTLINSTFVKELRKLNRDMKEIIIIDNSPLSYVCNKGNGIPIESWYENRQDRELDKLIPILEFLSEVVDVREYIPRFIINNELSYIKANYVMKKYDYEHRMNSNSVTTLGNNQRQLDKNAQSTSAPKTKKKKYCLGSHPNNNNNQNVNRNNSNSNNIKPLKLKIHIKIFNNNISNIVINKQMPPHSNTIEIKNQLKESVRKGSRSESDGDLMKYFLKETNGIKLHTPNTTLRNNIVLNYQAMKRKIKQKKYSVGDSFVFGMNKPNIIEALSHTQNCTDQNIKSLTSNNTFANSDCNKNKYLTDIQQYSNKINGIDRNRPTTSIRLNAFSSIYDKSAIKYSHSNTSNTNHSMSNLKKKTNSFTYCKNEWRNVNTNRPIISKKGTHSKIKQHIIKEKENPAQIKELKKDSNDFMIQRFKLYKTSWHSFKQFN